MNLGSLLATGQDILTSDPICCNTPSPHWPLPITSSYRVKLLPASYSVPWRGINTWSRKRRKKDLRWQGGDTAKERSWGSPRLGQVLAAYELWGKVVMVSGTVSHRWIFADWTKVRKQMEVRRIQGETSGSGHWQTSSTIPPVTV